MNATLRYRGHWASILGLSLGMMVGVSQAQQTPALSASASSTEAMMSAPEPTIASAPQPLMSPGSSTLRIASPVADELRVADRQFWTLVGITAGTEALDGETTIRGLQTPGRQEMNPLLGTHPNRARFYATAGATDAGMAYLAYHLKRSGHDKLWKLPLVGASSVHLGGAINNLRYP